MAIRTCIVCPHTVRAVFCRTVSIINFANQVLDEFFAVSICVAAQGIPILAFIKLRAIRRIHIAYNKVQLRFVYDRYALSCFYLIILI